MVETQMASYVWWTLASIQVLGLLIPSLARHAAGRRYQTFFEMLFYATFVCVALSTIGSLAQGSHMWVFSGFTLGWMCVIATWDVSHSHSAKQAAE